MEAVFKKADIMNCTGEKHGEESLFPEIRDYHPMTRMPGVTDFKSSRA
jgi:hypothetical protein